METRRKETAPNAEISLLNDTLSDLPVTDQQARQTTGGATDRPTESLAINFTKISYKYTPFDE
jgi:hypothetical protein